MAGPVRGRLAVSAVTYPWPMTRILSTKEAVGVFRTVLERKIMRSKGLISLGL